ncbi:F0F1 ATP synthase subunit A [Nocardioides marinquilinus]|uniref:ATP synthase subunit a n=1 Tax=Nocardioides marinquilinus TaxID=1210400 RepID=A0ABP9PMA1_9ACTN
MTSTVLAQEPFTPPGPGDFDLPAIFGGGSFDFFGQAQMGGVTKPMVLVGLSAIIAIGLLYAMSRRAAIVPGRLQFAGESVYGFVRNTIVRENIGADDAMKYVPYLFGLFMFVIINNYYGVIPVVQFPTMSRIGYVVAIALVAWLVYNIAGIRRHGLLGYLKLQTIPGGLTGPILIILIPLEFFSNILVRPVTLTLRLFATMFAGHLLLLVFSLGGEYLFFDYSGVVGILGGLVSWLMAILISFLELLIMFLQAYVFTLLVSMYIGLALADEH